MRTLAILLMLAMLAAGQSRLCAQQPRSRKTPPAKSSGSARISDYSWIYIDSPVPEEIKVHDIITIIVDEKSEVVVKSTFNRQRNGTLKAELKEFIRLDEETNLANAAANQPTVDTTLTSRLNSSGRLTDQEGVRYRIAATVVDIKPNGNLVLEARKTIRTNRDYWEYRLTGMLAADKVRRDRTATSDNIANLVIEKHQRGKIASSTKRPWGILLYDWFSPF